MATASGYMELHCHTHYSFCDGASAPRKLVEKAKKLGLGGLAITDHDGLYGAVQFAMAASTFGVKTVYGTELTLGKLDVSPGQADPDGEHLLVLAKGTAGYRNLCRVISHGQLQGEKGSPRMSLEDVGSLLTIDEARTLHVLTGCRKGRVPKALVQEGFVAAQRALDPIIDVFGADNVAVELWDHGLPRDDERNDRLYRLAGQNSLMAVATNNVHYVDGSAKKVAMALAAVKAHRSMEQLQGWYCSSGGAGLCSETEQRAKFRRYSEVVDNSVLIGAQCAFELDLIAPQLPRFDCPGGLDESQYLTELALAAATGFYGSRADESVVGAYEQIDYELKIIRELGFAGYFLIVSDIVRFCRENGIFCQGRGSAANSAVCYVLGITRADAVSLDLLFERFLSPQRDGPPDIDLDIESDRREEVIQYVYKKYGRHNAALVATTISYRTKSAVRDSAKALGYSAGAQDGFVETIKNPNEGALGDLPADVVGLAEEFMEMPRHMGIHTGGMVLCAEPVSTVCPIEHARMEGRTVLQWDKDDCAQVGLVKFDLLGLGMLSALRYATEFIENHCSTKVDLAKIGQEEAVYDMFCRADTIGVFQVESRAQMSTLPRLKPRCFYDLVVEVALIRPGPIQAGSVHPYLRRRNGEEPISYLHPSMEKSLRKTLGVPLFQEQLMQIAVDVALFSPAEADQLRQAMASKRSSEAMNRLKDKFYRGAIANGLSPEVTDEVWGKLAAFADFGFPESHSISFAYLVYASAWLKLHYPAAFFAALLKAQPMGFYSPHSLIQDAKRHGVVVKDASINHSEPHPSLEAAVDEPKGFQPPVGVGESMTKVRQQLIDNRRDDGLAIRLGLNQINNIGNEVAESVCQGRPYRSMEDLARRVTPGVKALEALAVAGALDCLGDENRRDALWRAGGLSTTTPGTLEGITTGQGSPNLKALSEQDRTQMDFRSKGLSVGSHPTEYVRKTAILAGVILCSVVGNSPDEKVAVIGAITHQQRPPTAAGMTFLSLEDESGVLNVNVSPGCYKRHSEAIGSGAVVYVRGVVERYQGSYSLRAEKIAVYGDCEVLGSRDFR